MISYEGFKNRHYPQKKHIRFYSEDEIAYINKNLPEGIAEFLEIEGLCSYSNGFLWTTSPDAFHQALDQWGLKGAKCFVFMRSAFGACIFFSRKEFFYLDPLEGRIVSLGDDAYMVLDIFLIMDAILTNGLFEDYFKNLKNDPSLLHQDEIFAFVPALPLGGSFESSKVEIVKMFEHLAFLAQLFDGKAKRI